MWLILVVLIFGASTEAKSALALPEEARFLQIIIPKEATLVECARRLLAAGVIKEPWTFLYKGFFGPKIVPGVYRFFEGEMSCAQVLQQITTPRKLKIRVPEGVTVFEIIRLLYSKNYLKGAIAEIPTEGFLFPSTYEVAFEESREKVIERLRKTMTQTVDFLWKKHEGSLDKSLIKTPKELLTLASIVEKETGVKQERQVIAAVFLNRLKLQMPLQADPTVSFALTHGKFRLDRKLTRKDTKNSSPYNTYMIRGLPPAPIACPGRASIEAVLNPASSKALYFVADGQGGHRFALSLEEHNHNVRLWKKSLQN